MAGAGGNRRTDEKEGNVEWTFGDPGLGPAASQTPARQKPTRKKMTETARVRYAVRATVAFSWATQWRQRSWAKRAEHEEQRPQPQEWQFAVARVAG